MDRAAVGIQVTMLEGVSRSSVDTLTSLLATHGEAVSVRFEPVKPHDDIEWLHPASIDIACYFGSVFLDGILGNLDDSEDDTQDEDIWDALVAALKRARNSQQAWFTPYGTVLNPLFRLRAFIEAHRCVQFTIPADVREEALELAVAELGDAIAHSTNIEEDLSLHGSIAGVFTVDLIFDPFEELWLELVPDDELTADEDEADFTY